MCQSLHLAVNMCINCGFVHLYLQFCYSLDDISYFGIYSFTCFQAVFIQFYWFRYLVYFWQFTLRKLFAQCSYNFSYFVLFCFVCRSRILCWDVWEPFAAVLAHFSLHMSRNGTISTSGLKSCFQRHRFPVISTETLAIWKCFLGFRHILLRMCGNGNFRVSGYDS